MILPENSTHKLNCRWWNVNGRWSLSDKRFMDETDIVFISESHGSCKTLPTISGFDKIGDPNVPLLQSHGGLVVYIRSSIYQHIQLVRFSKCSISFKFSFAPTIAFMGVYIYPYDSLNYDIMDFAILSAEIEFWQNSGCIPFVGGDMNSRLGDLNCIAATSLTWCYDDNVDQTINQHGKSLTNICEVQRLLPINHMIYYGKHFDGGYTYFKAGKMSQIDFILTNNQGRRLISNFQIMQTGWHESDHLPLTLSLKVPVMFRANMLLQRTIQLEPYIPSQQPLLHTHKYEFNVEEAKNELSACSVTIIDACSLDTWNADHILQCLKEHVDPMLEKTKIRKDRVPSNGNDLLTMSDECDRLFKKYVDGLSDEHCSDQRRKMNCESYQKQRNTLNNINMMKHENEYSNILKSGDDKKLWNKINWSGKLTSPPTNQPNVSELADHFETLYQPLEEENFIELQEIKSNVYIPATDDAITANELDNAAMEMKKGGWDYSLPVLRVMMSCVSVCMLMLCNAIFFHRFPLQLALSILHAIPKTGNLSLPTNFRGIQIQPLFAVLYDRIIGNRLISWAKICYEQTAFQKGKGTLNQIFTVRLLIALTKRYKRTLYIGFFDLSKAFDKVSRVLLLQSLVKMGVGSCLLEAIKAMYAITRCVLKSCGKLSDIFCTYTGIKQGAPSSVILFIIFMNNIVETIKEKCADEFLIGNLHILLHADDTMVFSLDHESFVNKCNALLDILRDKKLTLNFKKSSYMIIHANNDTLKCDLKLATGWLPYKSSTVYLGSIITDSGVLHLDVKKHAINKGKNVSIKLANFVYNNLYAPATVKNKILNSCVNAAVLYSSETWSSSSLADVETLHRKAIKTAFGIKKNTPNDIVYMESGHLPLKSTIYKRQYKFWSKIKKEMEDNPDSPITKLYQIGINSRVPFLRHYLNLHQEFTNEDECFKFYNLKERDTISERIRNEALRDPKGVRGVYLTINPALQTHEMYGKYITSENRRLILTKYRTGSHYLNIQKGRYLMVDRNQRTCVCASGIQDLQHVVFECPLTQPLRNATLNFQNFQNLNKFLNDVQDAPTYLRTMEVTLKLR